MIPKPKFMPTGIGSMPFKDIEHAITVSLERMRQGAPIWPQLPAFGLREQMEIQYSEGMPNAVIDETKGRMFFDTASDYSEGFGTFYENYLAAMDAESGSGDCSCMAITPAFSKGLYALDARLKGAGGAKLPWLKVQTTGPCSFALTIVDEQKRAIYYNEEFRDMITKALAMKCRWQIQKFAPCAENIICFIDEPILSAFGSSTYVSVNRDDVVNLLKELIAAVHADHALAGIHCCGNTEWSILVDAGVDILNFDAFGYAETVAMYADSIRTHLQRGGILAWGVVPTSTEIRNQTEESLEAKLEAGIDKLAATGIDKTMIVEQAMLTPSCGTGSMQPEDAERVFELLEKLAVRMKAKYGFASA